MIYGYGIVDKDGNPWWDECCVCADRNALEDSIENLNNGFDHRVPYKIVQLTFRCKNGKYI